MFIQPASSKTLLQSILIKLGVFPLLAAKIDVSLRGDVVLNSLHDVLCCRRRFVMGKMSVEIQYMHILCVSVSVFNLSVFTPRGRDHLFATLPLHRRVTSTFRSCAFICAPLIRSLAVFLPPIPRPSSAHPS